MITGGFGMMMDLERGTMRQWVLGADGVRRWADTNDPVDVLVVHVTPAIDESCDHDWGEGADGNPERCTKCGLSFTRYIHCCMP